MKINVRQLVIPLALVCVFFAGSVNAAERNIIAEMRLEKTVFRPSEPIKVNVLVKNMGSEALPFTFKSGQYVGPSVGYGVYLFAVDGKSEIGSNHGPLSFSHVYLTGVPPHSEISLMRFEVPQFMGISSSLQPGEYILFISFDWLMADNTHESLYAESYFTIGKYNDIETVLGVAKDVNQRLISIDMATSVIRIKVDAVKSVLDAVYALEQKIFTYAVNTYNAVLNIKR